MKTIYNSLRTMALGAAAICSLAAMAVTNDITVVRAQPAAGDLDAEMRSLNEVAITLSQPVVLGEIKKQATLTGVDGTEYKSDIKVNAYTKSILQLDFGNVTLYNGTYTLTIPKWSVGDEEWLDNYEAGHSNAELKVEWNVYNALEYGKDYSLTPNQIQPADGVTFSYTNGVELQQIRITYYRDANLIPGAKPLLTCAEARFNRELAFTTEKTGNKTVFSAEVSPRPSVDGHYTLIIPAGTFGDDAYVATGEGAINPPIVCQYEVTGIPGMDGEGSFFVDPIELPAEVKSVNPEQGLVDTGGSANPLGVKAIAVQFNTNEVEVNANAEGEFTLYKDGEKVASAPVAETYADSQDDTIWGFTFPGIWLNNGIYRVEIPAGVWMIEGVESPAISLNYEIFHTMEVAPNAGQVEKLDNFKIDFPGAAKVELNGTEIVLYQDYSTNKWELESLVKTQSVMLAVDGAAITADGIYSLELPKGLFTIYYEGKPGVEDDTRTATLESEEMILKYYITSMPKPAIEPAEGSVDNFYEFTLTAPEGFEMWSIDDKARSGIYAVLDDGTLSAEPLYQLRTLQVGEKAVLTVLDSKLSPVAAPVVPAEGNYRLVLGGSIFSGMYQGVQVNSIPYEYNYSISAGVGVEPIVGENTTVTLPGIYNMQGIRINLPLEALPKGMYIVNGKKIVK